MANSIFVVHGKNDVNHVVELRKKLNILINTGQIELLSCEHYYANLTHDDSSTSLFDNLNKATIIIVLLSDSYFEYFDDFWCASLHQRIVNFHSDKDEGKKIISFVTEDCSWSDDKTIVWNVFDKTDTLLNGSFNYNFARDKIKSQVDSMGNERATPFENILKESLLYLNYDDERDDIHKHLNGGSHFNPLNLFLLRGTEECALRLFVKKFVFTYKINHDHEFFLNMHQLDNYEKMKDYIWTLLAQSGLKKIDTSIGFEEFAHSLLTESLNKRHVIIRFDNFNSVKHENLKIIQGVWHQLFTYFANSRVKPQHSIFLFLIDHTGKENISINDFQGAATSEICNKLVCIPRKTKYLSSDKAKNWLDNIRGMPDLKQIGYSLELEDIIPNGRPEIPIARAIDNIVARLSKIDKGLKTTSVKFY
jgi:hypothetical protein